MRIKIRRTKKKKKKNKFIQVVGNPYWGVTAQTVVLWFKKHRSYAPNSLYFERDRIQVIQFMKNLAIIGGLLMVYYFGSGPVSLDARTTSKSFE